jgi:hypothetical protein
VILLENDYGTGFTVERQLGNRNIPRNEVTCTATTHNERRNIPDRPMATGGPVARLLVSMYDEPFDIATRARNYTWRFGPRALWPVH